MKSFVIQTHWCDIKNESLYIKNRSFAKQKMSLFIKNEYVVL
jgi:hypothetical protein